MPEPTKRLTLVIKDLPSLYAAYMPFLKNGGLFIPTASYFRPRQSLEVKVQFLQQPPMTLFGYVAWRTPVGAQGRRIPGVGLHFAEVAEGELPTKKYIESLLGELLTADKPTQTL